MTQPQPVRVGLVGYGAGGMYFHSPFIEAAEGVELAGVVTRNAGRRSVLQDHYPGVPAYGSLAELVVGARQQGGLDAVRSRRDCAQAGVGSTRDSR